MNNITLVQLIELNRRAAGYPPSPVTLPETTPKAAKAIDDATIVVLVQKWRVQMERGAVANGN